MSLKYFQKLTSQLLKVWRHHTHAVYRLPPTAKFNRKSHAEKYLVVLVATSGVSRHARIAQTIHILCLPRGILWTLYSWPNRSAFSPLINQTPATASARRYLLSKSLRMILPYLRHPTIKKQDWFLFGNVRPSSFFLTKMESSTDHRKAAIQKADEELLATLGYKQEFKREFTPLEVSLNLNLTVHSGKLI